MAEKIVITTEQALLRKGLRYVIESQFEHQVLEATNKKQAWSCLSEECPSLVILDLEMPHESGIEIAKMVEKQGIPADIIFFVSPNNKSAVKKARDIEAKGFLLSDGTVNEITDCIETVLEDEFYMSKGISLYLIRRKEQKESFDTNKLSLLTEREKDILSELSKMKTNAEIAKELGISIKTVQNHRNNICKKLELSGTHALLKYAVNIPLIFRTGPLN